MKTLEQLTQKQRDNYYQNLGVWKLINKKVKNKFKNKFSYFRIYTEIQAGGKLRAKYWIINEGDEHKIGTWIVNKFPGSSTSITHDKNGSHLTIHLGKAIKPESEYKNIPQYYTFTSIQGSRKPNNPEDVSFKVGVKEISNELREKVKQLPVLELPYDYFSYGSFFDDFKQYKEIKTNTQYYLIKWNGSTYFVDNQGFDYARYVTKIIGKL